MEKFYKYILLILSLAICSGLFSQIKPKDFSLAPNVKWKFKAEQPFISSPVIEGNLVYTGNFDGNLYAIDLKSGKEKWKFKTGGEIRSDVSISVDKLFLTSGDGNLYALDKSTGSVIWTFKASDKKYDPYDYHQSTPLVNNNNVYFGMGDGNIYCLSAADGKLIWKYQTDDVVHSSPAIADGKVYIGSFDGYVYALDAMNGSLIWKFKTVGHNYFPRGEVQFSPTQAGKSVYIAARDYNLYTLDMNKGVCRWNREFPAGWATTVTYSQDRDSMILIGTSDPRKLIAMNRATEKVYWEAELKSQVFGKCALSESMCYVGTLIGKINAVDINTGEVKWTFSTDGYNANHLNYYTADDEYREDIISIVKDDAGMILAGYKCGAIYSTPAITDNELVFSSTDGTIYCLGR